MDDKYCNCCLCAVDKTIEGFHCIKCGNLKEDETIDEIQMNWRLQDLEYERRDLDFNLDQDFYT